MTDSDIIAKRWIASNLESECISGITNLKLFNKSVCQKSGSSAAQANATWKKVCTVPELW